MITACTSPFSATAVITSSMLVQRSTSYWTSSVRRRSARRDPANPSGEVAGESSPSTTV